MNRTFTPFQIWLETEVAKDVTMTAIAARLQMKPSQLTRLRKGENSFPAPRLAKGIEVTGLTLEELTVKASPEIVPEPVITAPATAPEPPPARPVVVFDVTPERVHLCLQHGLRFGTERALFCDSNPEGDLDAAWAAWLERREHENPSPEPDEVPPLPPEQPELYAHLKRDAQRPDHGRNPSVVQGGDGRSNYTIVVGGSEE